MQYYLLVVNSYMLTRVALMDLTAGQAYSEVVALWSLVTPLLATPCPAVEEA